MNPKTKDKVFAACAGALFYGLVALVAIRYGLGVTNAAFNALCTLGAGVIGAVVAVRSMGGRKK